MCVCTHVNVCTHRNVCTSTSAHVWKPKGDVQHHPQLLFLYEAVALNQSQSCTLSGWLALGIPCLCLPMLELQTRCHTHLDFMWALGI